MKSILIAGGSGLLGNAVRQFAESHGYEVTILSRSDGHKVITWDPSQRMIHMDTPRFFDAIINLTGRSLSETKWTKEAKKEIRNSRIDSCLTITKYLRSGLLRTGLYIGASGVGIYGNRPDETVTEASAIYQGKDWFINLVKDWEAAHLHIKSLGIRTIVLRIGIVMSEHGGALKEIIEKSKSGVLPYFGDGEQYWSWIHIEDFARIVFHCIRYEKIEGVLNATSPDPLTNKEFIATIRQYLPGKYMIGAPRIALKLMLGKMHRVLFDSCRAIPERLLQSGFTFNFPSMNAAAKNLLGRRY